MLKRRNKHAVKTIYLNHLHRMNAIIYVLAICFLGGLVSYYASALEKNNLMQQNHDASYEITRFYENKEKNFWSVYRPMYKETAAESVGKERMYLNAVLHFFEGQEADWIGNVLLMNMLEEIAAQDSDIRWILLNRDLYPNSAYLFVAGTRTLTEVSGSFPFIDQINSMDNIRKLLGSKYVRLSGDINAKEEVLTYAIGGDVYSPHLAMSVGDFVVGYDTNAMDTIFKSYSFTTEPPDITIATYDGDVIYDSTGKSYNTVIDVERYADKNGTIEAEDGEKLYAESYSYPEKNYFSISTVPWNSLNRLSQRSLPLIWGITIVLAALAAFLYILSGHLSSKKVNVILDSLVEIGKDNLSYRIPITDDKDEFGVIAKNINHMTEQMQQYVEKVYIYSIKQKNAELGELQAKFNPHFLYNTLEVIRAQLQEKGDDETADMVLLLSRIFRNFINKRSFVTIQEELSFCDVYLELFRLRYKDAVEVEFDVDTEVLAFGIIRNLLQPVIENYFVHGFVADRSHNHISITGCLAGQDNEYVILTVADDGSGIPREKLLQLEQELESPTSTHEDGNGGYGLKNLHDRIQVFYGEDCGLFIHSDLNKGTKIQVKIRKMTCRQHEEQIKQDL